MKKQIILLFILILVFVVGCGGIGDSVVKDFIKANEDFANAVNNAGSSAEIVAALEKYTEAAAAFFKKAAESPESTTVSAGLQEEMTDSQTKVTEAFMKISEYLGEAEVKEAYDNMINAMSNY